MSAPEQKTCRTCWCCMSLAFATRRRRIRPPLHRHGGGEALAQQLQQGIKEGKLSEAEVQQGLLSGHLGEKLKSLNPQAGALLEDISDAMKNGKGPGAESLMPLLGGLGIGVN